MAHVWFSWAEEQALIRQIALYEGEQARITIAGNGFKMDLLGTIVHGEVVNDAWSVGGMLLELRKYDGVITVQIEAGGKMRLNRQFVLPVARWDGPPPPRAA